MPAALQVNTDMTRYSRTQLEDPLFWRKLVPAGTISNNPLERAGQAYSVEQSTLDISNDQLHTEGYFQTPPLLDTTDCAALKSIVQTVVKAGLRPTYALLFDQFYEVLARLDPLLCHLLGNEYQIVPDELEVFYINHREKSAGTPPHRDAYSGGDTIMDNGKFKLINVWIPLTDATPTNSCMYVVPAHLDDNFPERHRLLNGRPTASRKLDLQNIRALPAAAGSIIGWNPNLLHWGSRSSCRAEYSRISFAVYFQRGDVAKMHPTTSSLLRELPFEYRLYLVEKVWRDRAGDELAGLLDKYFPNE